MLKTTAPDRMSRDWSLDCIALQTAARHIGRIHAVSDEVATCVTLRMLLKATRVLTV